MQQGLFFFGSLMLTAVMIPALRQLAERIGLVDQPGERKTHEGIIPIHGGVCLALVVLIAGVVLHQLQSLSNAEWVFLLGLMLFAVIGVLDDLRDLSARLRLVAEVILLFWLMSSYDFHIDQLGDLWGYGDVSLGWLTWPFTLFAIFCLINGMNMLDGMDGLAGGIAAISLGWFMISALHAEVPLTPVLWALSGALLAFLFYNVRSPWRSRAAVFMGDAGSLVLGFTLCWCCIAFTQHGIDGAGFALSPMTAVWIMALPVIDTVYVVLKRARSGVGIFTPGRDHIHHRVQQLGFSDTAVVYLLWLVSAVLGGIGVLADMLQVPEPVMCYGFIVMAVLYYFAASKMQHSSDQEA